MLTKIFFQFLILFFVFFQMNSYSQPLAQGRSKFLGAATSHNIWAGFRLYWNQITPGNAGKWGSVENTRGQYNWSNLDAIYNYARTWNIPFKEHVLIWGQQQPSWISTLDSANQRLAIEKWIDTLGKRYPHMEQCEVVNEPINAPPAYKNALGGDGVTGWDWVITAFQLARQACASNIKLILNEYNILHSNDRTNTYLTIINLLKDRNLIDGIGIQGHYFEFRSDISNPPTNAYQWDIPTIRFNLNRLTATGLPVYITEFDIDERLDTNQVNQYKIYFPIFWQNPGVKGITFWGYNYYDVWSAHPYTFLFDQSYYERPALQWLRKYVTLPLIPILSSPINVTSGLPRNPLLIWRSSEAAKSYRLQVSTLSNFPINFIVVDTTIIDTVIRVNTLSANTTYYWRVSAINDSGASDYSLGTAAFRTGDQFVSVNELREIPTHNYLKQNFPNPFNPVTIISYQIMANSIVNLKVFDILGREVATLVNEYKPAGAYSVTFDASNLPSGIYFYRLRTGNFLETKKLVVQK